MIRGIKTCDLIDDRRLLLNCVGFRCAIALAAPLSDPLLLLWRIHIESQTLALDLTSQRKIAIALSSRSMLIHCMHVSWKQRRRNSAAFAWFDGWVLGTQIHSGLHSSRSRLTSLERGRRWREVHSTLRWSVEGQISLLRG